jgi:hypothetical protein
MFGIGFVELMVFAALFVVMTVVFGVSALVIIPVLKLR